MRDPEFKDNVELSLRLDGGGAKPQPNVWKRLSRVMEVVIYVLLILAVVKLFSKLCHLPGYISRYYNACQHPAHTEVNGQYELVSN